MHYSRRMRLALTLLPLAVLTLTSCMALPNIPGALDVPVGEQEVTYTVTSDAATAGSVAYASVSSDGSGQSQTVGAPMPFTFSETLPVRMIDNIFSLTAQASPESTTITCKITVDGDLVVEQTSTGPSAVVTCAGSR